ncbi:hypothetical protein Sj15T_17980 [Sphingobium sp. TA15]|nr:hypothetical protein Sj15T_17980 [Sphingobium sp. TA15]
MIVGDAWHMNVHIAEAYGADAKIADRQMLRIAVLFDPATVGVKHMRLKDSRDFVASMIDVARLEYAVRPKPDQIASRQKIVSC